MNSHNNLKPRWWIPGPGEDESLLSVVSRAKTMYEVESSGFDDDHFPAFGTSPEQSKLDGLRCLDRHKLAKRIGVPAVKLASHRLPGHPSLLVASQRYAYCPSCWLEDDEAGRPRAYRRAWAGVFDLSCDKHHHPLRWGRTDSSYGGSLSSVTLKAIAKYKLSRQATAILEVVDRLACALGQCLWKAGTWPTGWRGNAQSARAFLMRCAVNLSIVHEHPPMALMARYVEMEGILSTPVHRLPPCNVQPWEAFRALGPPAWRRTALWVTAWHVIPDLSVDLHPPCMPYELFELIDRNWDTRIGGRQWRRLKLYRSFLKAQCGELVEEKNGRAALLH